jgi:PTS system mannitol-specific IIC component
VQNFLASGVNYMTEEHLIPLAALFVQPAQILFLNNAINHGIMVPLGLQQTAELGKSVLFLVEANGAIWVGLAAAFAVFGNGIAKKTAPGAVVIMFLGGIAEVCFPYCLMMPITIIGPIVGNMFSLFMLTMFDGGVVGPPSPGSVFAFYLMTPKSSLLINTIAYFGSMAITFVVTSAILKFGKQSGKEKDEKLGAATFAPAVAITAPSVLTGDVKKVIFACDAGMGSSAMGVSILKDKLKKVGLTPEIAHVAVSNIPADADVVVTNENLAKRAVKVTGGKVPILTLANFMNQQEYDRIVNQITNGTQKISTKVPIFGEDNIVLGAKFASKREAIAACGDIFIQRGYTDQQYKEDMFKRDEDNSVYLGNGVAMPHGLDSSKKSIRNSGICFIQVPEGVDFDGNTAYLLIGVAGNEEEHVDILGKIGMSLTTDDNIERLRTANNKQEVLDILKF